MKNSSSFIVRSLYKVFYIVAAAFLVAGIAVTGFLKPVLADNPNQMVTLCHAAGQEGTLQFVTLTISWQAAYGQAGHFNEDGTPQAGHEDDYLGACRTAATTTPTATATATETQVPTATPTLPPTLVTICFNNETISVDESALGQYEGYTLGECDVVGQGTPVPTLRAPAVSNAAVLIPVTGVDSSASSNLFSGKLLFFNLEFVFAGLGLVLQGISKKL